MGIFRLSSRWLLPSPLVRMLLAGDRYGKYPELPTDSRAGSSRPNI